MIIFILGRPVFDELVQKPSLIEAATAIWINGGVLNDEEIKALRTDGLDVTTFSGVYDPSDFSALEEAVSIISEHHPGCSIWLGVSAFYARKAPSQSPVN
jgi:hypothetical protein